MIVTLIDIENMSAAEIKQRWDDCADAARGTNAADLAQRYVQARFDAKLRDEKLAEQARTIEGLSTGLESAREANDGWKSKVEEMRTRIAEAEHLAISNGQRIVEMREEISAIKKRAEAAEKLAKDRRGALADIMTTIAPLLAQEG